MFAIIGAMAERECNIIRERTIAGLEYAGQHRTKSGSAIGAPNWCFCVTGLRLHTEGISDREIARRLRVGESTVRRSIRRRSKPLGSAPKFCKRATIGRAYNWREISHEGRRAAERRVRYYWYPTAMIPCGRFGRRAFRRGIVPAAGASVALAALLDSRLRYAPNHPFFYDNGNLAFALQHFDPALH